MGSFSAGVSVSSSQNAGGLGSGSGSQSPTSNLPAIVYTSRTHSQIRQVIQELKRTSYRSDLFLRFMLVNGAIVQFYTEN